MSPFGSQAMLHGLRNPSATVTTLKLSPGGPGGCAHVEVETVSVAAARSPAAARMDARDLDGDFMDDSFSCAPPRSASKKSSAATLPIVLCPARTGFAGHLSAKVSRWGEAQSCREISIQTCIDRSRPLGEAWDGG